MIGALCGIMLIIPAIAFEIGYEYAKLKIIEKEKAQLLEHEKETLAVQVKALPEIKSGCFTLPK